MKLSLPGQPLRERTVNSLSKKGVPVFDPGPNGNTIAWEHDMYEGWKKDHPKESHSDYEKWRKEQFEKFDEYAGYKVKGVNYPK
jgi:phage terminase Nu1 subunit (DNA packaging protein)